MSYRDDHEPVPATFADLADTDLAKALRKFIASREMVAAMAEATDLRRPAVAALPPATVMVRMFGKEVKADRVKQYIGYVVRQVMEKGPFELAVRGIKIGGTSLFTRGSRYRRRRARWGALYVEGHRRNGGRLWGDLGVDDLDGALAEIGGFLRACLAEQIPDALIESRNVSSTPSRKADRPDVAVIVKGSDLAKALDQIRAELTGAPAPAVNFTVTFEP